MVAHTDDGGATWQEAEFPGLGESDRMAAVLRHAGGWVAFGMSVDERVLHWTSDDGVAFTMVKTD